MHYEYQKRTMSTQDKLKEEHIKLKRKEQEDADCRLQVIFNLRCLKASIIKCLQGRWCNKPDACLSLKQHAKITITMATS